MSNLMGYNCRLRLRAQGKERFEYNESLLIRSRNLAGLLIGNDNSGNFPSAFLRKPLSQFLDQGIPLQGYSPTRLYLSKNLLHLFIVFGPETGKLFIWLGY